MKASLDEKIAPKGGISYSISASLNSTLGQGTFVEDEYARNEMFAQTLSISPSLSWEKFSFGLNMSASLEYTDSDSTTEDKQVMLNDMILSARRPILSQDDHYVNLSGSFSAVLPTSLYSQRASLYTSLKGSLSVSRRVAGFSFSYTFGAKKNFHEYTQPVLREEDLSDFSTYGRIGGAEMVAEGLIASGGNNVSFGFTNVLGVSYKLTQEFSASLSFAYITSFIYKDYDDDDYTSENASSSKDYRDMINGGLRVSYTHKKYDFMTVTLGIDTTQPPKSSNNDGFRFPFFDFKSSANNFTSFYLDIAVNF